MPFDGVIVFADGGIGGRQGIEMTGIFPFGEFASPGGQLDAGKLQPGDMLLGRQVMFLTIDAKGAIQSCKVVASSGDAPPDYGCNEAKQEQFKAEANADATDRQAFMTVLAYGHLEQIA